MFTSTTRILMAGLFLCVSATPSTAVTPEDDITAKIEAKAEEAARHFNAKDYAKAVRAYTEAYQIAQRPSELLYNIAFIYDEKLKEYEMAAIYYKKYAATIDGDPALVEKAINRMGELRKMAANPKVDPNPKVKPDPKTKVPLKGPVTTPKPATSGLETGGIAAMVTGGILMAAGAGLYVGAMLTNDEFQLAQTPTDRASLANDGRTFALAGDIAMGVGGAAALVGIILFAMAPGDAETSGAVKVGAHWLPEGGATFVIGGSL